MINEAFAPDQEPRGFSAVLRPHRSLTPTGFVVLMGIVSFISFTTGLVFYLAGAWPVLGFCGLDVLIIYIAFRLNYRSGRLHEVVRIKDADLTVTRLFPSGRQERYVFNPYWTRVKLAEGKHGRTDLRLHLHGKELSFGRFLTDDERRDFAQVLTEALLAARGGVRI